MNVFDPNPHTIFVTLAGSQAHGTARPGSDVDLRGVCIAPLSVRLSLFREFEQSEAPLEGSLWEQVRSRIAAHPTAANGLQVRSESVVFELAKFLRLCAAANPNALEILFADERDWLFAAPAWQSLVAQRQQFLTKKVGQTFLGYALAQLKRIRTHRAWLLTPPKAKPSRADFGLPDSSTLGRDDQHRIEQGIADKIRSYGIDTLDLPKATRVALDERLRAFWQDTLACSEEELENRMRAVATQSLSLPVAVVATLNAERRYLAALKDWHSYQTWQNERNAARATLEREHGYDTKHAMHLVRLMRMGLEILNTGELRVRRQDAAELNEIRDGSLDYDTLLTLATDLQRGLEQAVRVSHLPSDVDFAHVDALSLSLARGSE
ncbi:MAG TPA: nucleotidyltransferase domain-containing protein [Polyangiaceae bacterium]|nr:nucleotidyltransferase domain-containing protein [Polyangiaceae bacterium]